MLVRLQVGYRNLRRYVGWIYGGSDGSGVETVQKTRVKRSVASTVVSISGLWRSTSSQRVTNAHNTKAGRRVTFNLWPLTSEERWPPQQHITKVPQECPKSSLELHTTGLQFTIGLMVALAGGGTWESRAGGGLPVMAPAKFGFDRGSASGDTCL